MKTISSSFFCFLFLCLLQYSSSQGGCCCFSEWKSDAKILPSDKWKENRNFPWYEEVTHVTMYYSLDQKGAWLYNVSSNQCTKFVNTYWMQLCFDATSGIWFPISKNSTTNTIVWEYKLTGAIWLVGAPCNPLTTFGPFGALDYFSVAFGDIQKLKLSNETWILPNSCQT